MRGMNPLGLQTLNARRKLDGIKTSHPKTHALYSSKWDSATRAQIDGMLERYGDQVFDTIEITLSDMMAMGSSFGVSSSDNVRTFLDQLYSITHALPHDTNFEAFEEVVEQFYEHDIYPLLEHSIFLSNIGLERLYQVRQLLPDAASSSVADVAVGPAAILADVLQRYPHILGKAFDIAAPCVRYAEQVLNRRGFADRCQVERADARELPVKDGSFDLVIATEVIEHVPNPKRLLAELHRILAPQHGVLIASVPIDLPWGPHLAHFETEADVRALFDDFFETEDFQTTFLGRGLNLCFGRFRVPQ